MYDTTTNPLGGGGYRLLPRCGYMPLHVGGRVVAICLCTRAWPCCGYMPLHTLPYPVRPELTVRGRSGSRASENFLSNLCSCHFLFSDFVNWRSWGAEVDCLMASLVLEQMRLQGLQPG